MIPAFLDVLAATVALSVAIVLIYVGTPMLVHGKRFLDVLIGGILVSLASVSILTLFGVIA